MGLTYAEREEERQKRRRQTPAYKNNYRKWAKKNPEKKRASKIKSKFGMTPGDYEKKLIEQRGVCAICKQKEFVSNRHLAVDHSHVTQKNRGLLCTKCNSVLGWVNEDITTLHSMIQYLELWSKS